MVRDQLWYEMVMALKYNKACANYTDKRRTLKRKFDLCLVVFPAIGLGVDFVLKFFQLDSTGIATLLGSLATMSVALLKQVVPIVSQPEKELFQLDELGVYYGKRFVELLKLWRARENSQLTNEEVSEKLLLIMDENVSYEMNLNRLMREAPNDEDIEKEAESYMHIACFDDSSLTVQDNGSHNKWYGCFCKLFRCPFYKLQ